MKTSVYGMQQHQLFAGLRANMIIVLLLTLLILAELIVFRFSCTRFNCFIAEMLLNVVEVIIDEHMC
jgi:hypothetical protein